MDFEFARATTPEELAAVQRLRYAVYVEEMHRYDGVAGRSDVAAVLLGYIEIQPQRGRVGWEGAFHDAVVAEVRAALGDDAYDASAARGAAMAYDDVVRCALAETDGALASDRTA